MSVVVPQDRRSAAAGSDRPDQLAGAYVDPDPPLADESMSARQVLAGLIPLALAVAAFVVAVRQADGTRFDGLGLFRFLPMWYWVSTTLLAAGFIVGLPGPRSSAVWAVRTSWLYLVAMIVFLHGLPGLIEPHPRFGIAWIHAGFSDHIADNGQLLTNVDARFSWPGFFAASGYLQNVAGTDTLLWIIRFAPVFLNVVIVSIVIALARALGSTHRQSLVAAMIFVVADWIGQDYFAPQAIGFIITYGIVAVLLTHFSNQPEGWRLANRIAGQAAPDRPALVGRQAAVVYLLCVFLVGALVVTHQISPALLAVLTLALALVGRIRTTNLPFVVGLAFLGWLSFGAEAYWFGHLDQITGSVGNVSSVVDENVNERAVEGSFDRDLLVRVRIFSMLLLWGLTSGVMLLRRVKGRLDPALPALFFPPFVVVALQPYGGEVLLRVAFFVLPAVAITLATTDWTSMAVSRLGVVAGRAATIVLLAAAVPVFILARFGNESYEAVLDDDLVITEVMYDAVPEGTVLFRANSFALSWVERVDEIRYRQLPEDIDDAVTKIQEQAETAPTWILLTESQQNWGRQVLGWEQGWLEDYGDDLEATGVVEVEARVGSNVLMRVLGAGG